MPKPILYSYYRSSCSWRVRIALMYKRIDFDIISVNTDAGEQSHPDYVALNPAKVIPTLMIDGVVLTESLAILEYLEETRPQPSLLPSDPAARALVRSIAQQIICGIQPLQSLRSRKQAASFTQEDPWTQHWITDGFMVLEQMLRKTHGRFCFGNEVTFADCCLAPQVYNAVRFGVPMHQFTTIQEINANLMELDVFQLSHPEKLKDSS